VVTGSGPHFCAGVDLTALEDTGWPAALAALLATLRTVPVPVIAAVQGAALGAGTQVALACDLRVVAPTARFGIPAARLGLMLDQATVVRLATLAGYGPASAMLLAAEEVDAEAALRLGLAQRQGDLAAAQAWAAEIADLAPMTIAGHKLALNASMASLADTAADPTVAEAHQRVWRSGDAVEGRAAFGQHRPPRFEGT
jgi:enoyl-CoA hydratase